MVDSVAVLSDIHGVLPALDAVLAEPEVRAADAIVVCGDTAAGPQPVEVLDRLIALGDRVRWVRGNADRELLEFRAGKELNPPDDSVVWTVAPWAARQLRDEHLRLFEDMPQIVELDVARLGRVLCCHATPRDDEEVVLVDSRQDRWREVYTDLDRSVDVVVCGHTHMPFVRLADRRLIVNPGSIGMPYGGPGAYWALLGPGVALRRTGFDYDAACARITADSTFPGAAEFADEYVRGRNSDFDALSAFGPRDGRQS